MKYEAYSDFVAPEDFHMFEFVSVGKHGSIPKRIMFVPMELPEVYSLEFGDIDENDEIDYYSVRDNGDRNKILATIVKAIEAYTDKYPKRRIYFCGSTKERTRLYRMAVGLNLDELSKEFDIYAKVNGQEEYLPFRKNMEISAFLIKRKIV